MKAEQAAVIGGFALIRRFGAQERGSDWNNIAQARGQGRPPSAPDRHLPCRARAGLGPLFPVYIRGPASAPP